MSPDMSMTPAPDIRTISRVTSQSRGEDHRPFISADISPMIWDARSEGTQVIFPSHRSGMRPVDWKLPTIASLLVQEGVGGDRSNACLRPLLRPCLEPRLQRWRRLRKA